MAETTDLQHLCCKALINKNKNYFLWQIIPTINNSLNKKSLIGHLVWCDECYYYIYLTFSMCAIYVGIFSCIGTIGSEKWNPLCSGEYLYESFQNPSVLTQIQGWCIYTYIVIVI